MLSRLARYAPAYLCLVMVIIWLDGNLTLYIHPRYVVFTISMVTICLVLIMINLSKSQTIRKVGKAEGFLYVCLVLMTLLPPASLTSTLAPGRLQANTTREQTLTVSSFDVFSQDLSRFELKDWATYLQEPLTEDQIVGKKAEISGFLLTNSNNQKLIARYRLTCCAVDATPLVVPIMSNGAQIGNDGDWVVVSGVFKASENSSTDYPFQLNIEQITPIDVPEQPYVY